MEFDFNSQLIANRQYLDNFARKFALGEDDRKDLVSETILKALDKRDYFYEGNEKNFRSWLITIMTNIFINNYRRNERVGIDNYDNEQMALLAGQGRFSQSTDADFNFKELSDLVKRSLSQIDYRVFMGHVNGFGYEQIAEVMNLPLGTVKSKINGARKKIIKNLKCNYYESS